MNRRELFLASRRRFVLCLCGIGPSARLLARNGGGPASEERIAPAGPASRYVPVVQGAFVRRKEEYGMLWPGAIYDGEAALRKYRAEALAAAKQMGLRLELRSDPIYNLEEAGAWIRQAAAQKADGLFLILLDRQQHAWPTAVKAVESGIPTVVFAPIGAAFTTNTWSLAGRDGVFIASTDDFRQAAYGLKMLWAGAKLREMRFVVLQGEERADRELKPFGTKLRYVPARAFLEEYRRTPVNEQVRALARRLIQGAARSAGVTEQDVINGIKSYVVARGFLEREQADGITMDCLGALGKTEVSLPCIAWSTMLDHGIPAACEADLGACITLALVQLLFDRPGFQQDPVPETATGCLIGAHCTCPTRLAGFANPPEPYYLSPHHGKRDAVPVPQWRLGQRVTVADVEFDEELPRPRMVISAGTVKANVAVPPAGGCVVSVMVELDGVRDLLNYPGFHQVFFYGDHKRDLEAYCRLYGIQPLVV